MQSAFTISRQDGVPIGNTGLGFINAQMAQGSSELKRLNPLIYEYDYLAKYRFIFYVI